MIPYDWVATKMNHWYIALKNNWIKKAEEMKEQVEKEIEVMEENQDAVVYYQLLKFRHGLMLDYLCPDGMRDIDKQYEDLKVVRENEKLTGMLEYYYNFFAGMYHFREKELILAMKYYKDAETQLNSFDCDEVAQAEFFVKLSGVYYYMKQTYFSMYYANRAYKLYLKYPTYGQRRVQCQFLISGNWLDKMYPEKALYHTGKALEDAKKLKIEYLIGSSHLNTGICYNQLEELDKADDHFRKAVKLYKNEKHSYLPKALFNLSHVKAKQEKWIDAEDLYFEGKEMAEKFGDYEFLTKLKMINGVYLSFDLDSVKESFEFFEKKSMYADIEEYGVTVAEFLERKDMLHDSIEFYRRVVDARRQIQRRDMINED